VEKYGNPRATEGESICFAFSFFPTCFGLSARVEKYRNAHGQLKENLFLPLFTDLPINYRFDNMRGKAPDILIL
jgi:hypothetical protein